MKKKSDFPIVSLLFMLIGYFLIGSILIIIPNGAPAIWGMDIPAFIISYLGYMFLIAACIYHAVTNR